MREIDRVVAGWVRGQGIVTAILAVLYAIRFTIEVEGTRGRIPGGVHLVSSGDDVDRLRVRDPAKVSYITQTTLSVDDTRMVVEALRTRFPQIVGPKAEDICYATSNRQAAVKKIAPGADLVLVIGAPNSSNSLRLVEVAERCGTNAKLIQRASDIERA